MPTDALVIAIGLVALGALGRYIARSAGRRWPPRMAVITAIGVCGVIGSLVGAMLAA